jgi:6-phosphogluconolactonase
MSRIIAAVEGTIEVVSDVPQAFAALVAAEAPRSLALSGGDTARRCYELLVTADVDWARVEVLFGDERWVPISDPDSNEGMARVTFLDQVGPRGVHSMREAGDTPDRAAVAYDDTVRALEPIDLVHLGLGGDGHTASLFPASPALEEAKLLVLATGDGLHPHERLTLTLPGIAQSRLVVFTVSGAEKHDAFARVQRDEPVPAARVRAERIVWLVDDSVVADA